MDLDRLEARLARAFRARPQMLGEAQIVWRRRPIPLWQWVEELMEEADWDEVGEGSLEDWPGSIQAVLDEHLHDVLFFYWDGLGPTSSVAGLQVLELGERGYLVYWNELESYRAVATLDPWRDDLVVSAAVKEILRKNGRPHGVELFGSVPKETTNRIPGLLPTAVVRQAYFDFLQWQERVEGDAWFYLSEEHFGRIVEPNHLQRSLDILHRAADHRLDDREDGSDEFDDDFRQRLFNEWFATAYEVEQ